MRCSAHVLALRAIFEARAHPVTGAAVLAAKLGVTAELLSEYASALGRNPNYQAWFAAAHAANRVLVFDPSIAPSRFSHLRADSHHYGVAGYFSGGHLFADGVSPSCLDCVSLRELGVVVQDVAAGPAADIPGDNPVFTAVLKNGGDVDFAVLDRFIAPEEHVIVYDKYIKESGMQLIEYIASGLNAGARLDVRTTSLGGSKCKAPAEILLRIGACNPGLQTTCKLVSIDFRRKAHDRYVFFGARLQAVFTAGLDCFGEVDQSSGRRSNILSKINVYSLEAADSLNIESDDGSILVTPCVPELNC